MDHWLFEREYAVTLQFENEFINRKILQGIRLSRKQKRKIMMQVIVVNPRGFCAALSVPLMSLSRH